MPLAVDASAWVAGLLIATCARYELSAPMTWLRTAVLLALLAVALQGLIGHFHHLYRGRYWFGSFEEVRAVAATVLLTAFLLTVTALSVPGGHVHVSTPVVGGSLALTLMFGARYWRRVRRERSAPATPSDRVAVLLFGAGDACRELVRAMLRDRHSRYLPVGLLDDDPRKRNLQLHGVSVLGGRDHLADAVVRTGASVVVFSVANANAQLVREIRRRTLAAGATFKVVPSVAELLDGRIRVADVREPRPSDLLGRRQIETDIESIAGYLRGKRVLVTGAGGSIGSELCRQIHRFGPRELMMLDRDESALHATQLALHGRALLDSPELILADLRDRHRVRSIVADRQPQVVFHAAALKHLTLLERNPAEAVKSNIWGTLDLLEACGGVDTFVNISTDKAANPVSVLGYSKRITERLTSHTASASGQNFLSVRFGNVLGSRGSVLTAFSAQMASGGPITVTHPDVTRYFMTVQEAVQLVIQAAVIGRPGEALVLDMGKPVRIADVARQMAEQAHQPIEIVYTGLRPGEKLDEELFGHDEHDSRPCTR
ncbi:dTDP-glucose 4,6-dehydratase [Phytohabitans suffuscus]|uniref:dTDP-glucose 4,6-dehydratase n=1 Tax=Phytohabitans suffuscus TaxID=624315 RepID=A0A6F8YCI0_9ACTN|nr:polysaccharide biosynthesis protein [Phytohabitans suffuscus]BCB83825.1 dTDP-glucose 4,6-dehydratase [Phytohabitans suffuscus]